MSSTGGKDQWILESGWFRVVNISPSDADEPGPPSSNSSFQCLLRPEIPKKGRNVHQNLVSHKKHLKAHLQTWHSQAFNDVIGTIID